MANVKKRASLDDVAKKACTNRNMVADVLKDCPKLSPEFKLKVLKAAQAVGYEIPPDNQHPNAKLTQETADKIFEGIVVNSSLEKIVAETGLSSTTALKYIRGVKVPDNYPSNEDEWKADVIGFLEIAIWKGTKRLAEESMGFIDDRTLPVSIAVLTDKLSIIKGQPTSIHLSIGSTISHRDLMKNMKERDVTPVNDEQLPD